MQCFIEEKGVMCTDAFVLEGKGQVSCSLVMIWKR